MIARRRQSILDGGAPRGALGYIDKRMKPANAKARALFGKLERLADPANGGTPDEIEAARRKLHRLQSRFDFSTVVPPETADIFSDLKPKRATRHSVHIHTFQPKDFDVANSVKWAIEQTTGISCVFRGGDLLAAATPGTAKKLAKVALYIAQSFQTLLGQFGRLDGVTASDRQVFVRGLYDGMMNGRRGVGERLPGSAPSRLKRTKAKKRAIDHAPRLAVHPYTVALGLGQQIRFAVPLQDISAELAQATRPAIGPERQDAINGVDQPGGR